MRRAALPPRPNWRQRVEAHGLLFHSPEGPAEGATYWGEGTYYAFTEAEVAALERATAEIHAMCLEAAADVIARGGYAELGIPAAAVPLIEASWEAEPPSLYGRLDLAFGADGVPRLLEYNADTPTSLLEAAVIQWAWLTDCFPKADQFNSLHERLIETWRDLGPHLGNGLVHFGCVADLEDEMTVGYLRDTAEQAGLATAGLAMTEVGWDRSARRFVDPQGRPIRSLFKLYPWEGLLADRFGPLVPAAEGLAWIEPAWKMLLASKGILAVLWRLFPGHPNLLPASRDGSALGAVDVVRKPLHGREGANVTIFDAAGAVRAESAGPFADDGAVYQAYTDLGCFDGRRPVLGSWLIGGVPAGIGIRETAGHITDDTARFVPHVIE